MASIFIQPVVATGGTSASLYPVALCDNDMVVGYTMTGVNAAFVYEINTWTPSGGASNALTPLVTAPGNLSLRGASQSGNVLVGQSFQSGTMTSWKIVDGVYSTFGDSSTRTHGVSADGSRIFGAHGGLPGYWTGGTFTSISGSSGRVTGASPDGTYLTGLLDASSGTAFVWDATNGLISILSPSFAPRVNVNGSAVTFGLNLGGNVVGRIWRRGIGAAIIPFPTGASYDALPGGTDPNKFVFQKGTLALAEFNLGVGVRTYPMKSGQSADSSGVGAPRYNAALTKVVTQFTPVDATHLIEGSYLEDVPQSSLNGGPFWTGHANSEYAE